MLWCLVWKTTWSPCHTMDPTAGKNSRSPQEKKLFPGFPRSRQGNRKSGIFPCQLTGNFFHGFSGIFSWVHQSPDSFGFFSLFFHQEFFSPCFSGIFSWAHQWRIPGRVMWCVEGGLEWLVDFFFPLNSAHPQWITWSVVDTRQPPYDNLNYRIHYDFANSLHWHPLDDESTTDGARRRRLSYGLETSASPATVHFFSLLFFFFFTFYTTQYPHRDRRWARIFAAIFAKVCFQLNHFVL